MAHRMSYWVLLTNPHITETYIDSEGDDWFYEISPDSGIKKADTVYFWRVYDNTMYGWGVVSEIPRINEGISFKAQRLLVVSVSRMVGFHPPLTRRLIETDRSLVGIIPSSPDDMYAVPLETLQAHHLNDVIRIHGLQAPEGSAPTRWSVEQPLPGVMIKAILQFGDRTNEGTLIRAVAFPWYEVLDRIRRDPQGVHEIDSRIWEEIIAGAYHKAGFDEVILTPRSGDKGRDVIATKNGVGSIRIIDQVKAYKPGHVVTAEEVRALIGVMYTDLITSKAVMTTTSTFAPRLTEDELIRPLIPHRLELKPRDILLPWLEELRTERRDRNR